jgi:hypothetical protein
MSEQPRQLRNGDGVIRRDGRSTESGETARVSEGFSHASSTRGRCLADGESAMVATAAWVSGDTGYGVGVRESYGTAGGTRTDDNGVQQIGASNGRGRTAARKCTATVTRLGRTKENTEITIMRRVFENDSGSKSGLRVPASLRLAGPCAYVRVCVCCSPRYHVRACAPRTSTIRFENNNNIITIIATEVTRSKLIV